MYSKEILKQNQKTNKMIHIKIAEAIKDWHNETFDEAGTTVTQVHTNNWTVLKFHAYQHYLLFQIFINKDLTFALINEFNTHDQPVSNLYDPCSLKQIQLYVWSQILDDVSRLAVHAKDLNLSPLNKLHQKFSTWLQTET